ncbi:hypothetical protein [Streptomyces rubiginosohelvolus]|uniref:hypothetical protein n=1 Tax=Streptomyces rubiginosohelvolus TaxID=67362 RepID=UPI0036925A22
MSDNLPQRIRTDELQPGDRLWHPYDMVRFTVDTVPAPLPPSSRLTFHNRQTDEMEPGMRVTGIDDRGDVVHVDAAPSCLWHRAERQPASEHQATPCPVSGRTPMTDAPMTPDREQEIRERLASTLKPQKTEVAELLAEVDRLRLRVDEVERAYIFDTAALKKRVAELEALKPAQFQDCQVCGAGYEYGKPCSACEFNKQMAAAATGEPRQARDLRPGAAGARRMLRRPGACFTCGDVPDEWCPDCACCKAGCDGGRTNNPCTHPNAPWNKEDTR